MKIGFIGQGWIGENYADDFENRGLEVVRYALEEPYLVNKDKIAECDIVFIAVPTPTTPAGFDDSYLKEVLPLIGEKKIAVIKSTIPPGVTEALQEMYPDIYVMHSPEFLVEITAAYNAANPERNIVGIPIENDEYRTKAEQVLQVLPPAPYQKIMQARNAEMVKYVGNAFLYTKVVFMNLLYDLAEEVNADWEEVREAVGYDSRIGHSHTSPVHSSGRGAGGHCFIKDYEVLRRFYEGQVSDPLGQAFFDALRDKNNQLLLDSQKDLDLLRDVYGEDMI